MKVKSTAPKEDPETAARRQVEEARAEADRTSATQGMLDRRTRRVMRIFGKVSGGTSGRSGVVAPVISSGSAGGGFAGFAGGSGGSSGGRGDFTSPYSSVVF